MAFLGGLFGGNNAGQKAYDKAHENMFQWAVPASEKLYEQARQPIGTYLGVGTGGLLALRDALGLGGESYDSFTNTHYTDPKARQAGLDRTRERFRTSPGYEFQMDQGVEALNRAAAARGRLAAGQTSMDLLRFGQGLADQEYNKYIDRITGLSDVGLKSAGAMSDIFTQQAKMYPDISLGLGKLRMEGALEDQKMNMEGGANLLSGILGGVKLLTGLFPKG